MRFLETGTYTINNKVFSIMSKTAMSNPRAACGPVEGFVRPTLVFAVVKVSCILIVCPYFDNFEFDILLQVVYSAALSRVLPLQ